MINAVNRFGRSFLAYSLHQRGVAAKVGMTFRSLFIHRESLQSLPARCVETYRYHQGPITALRFLPNRLLVSASERSGAVDAATKLKCPDNEDPPVTLDQMGKTTYSFDVLNPGSSWLLVTGCGDGTIPVWDLINGKGMWFSLGPHKDTVGQVVALPNGNIASGSWDQSVKLWNPAFPDPLLYTFSQYAGVYTATMLNKGAHIAASGQNGVSLVWDLDTKRNIPLPHPRDVRSSTTLLDGTTLMTGCDDCVIRAWNPFAKNPFLYSLAGSNEEVTALLPFPDGRTLMSGHARGEINLWDLTTRQRTTLPREHTAWITALTVEEGGTLYSGSKDTTIKKWGP